MSKVMTAAQFVALLDKWGIKHVARDGWDHHNRAGHGEFGDMHGVLMHHTGSKGKTTDQANLLWAGIGGSNPLPGPLCHGGIAPDGKVYLIGWGRANHAGLGDSAILNHVVMEDYDLKKTLRPTKADHDGNSCFYGFEIMYDGETPMTDEARKTAVRVAAAICTHHQWTAKSMIGHGEWQPGKWDPGAHGKLSDMGKFRQEVEQAIKEGPHPATDPTHYVVKKGDTLYSIARKFFDSPEAGVMELVDANPQLLQPGIKLNLPKK